MKIVPHKRFWLSFSTILVATGIALFGIYGLRLSADFTEGTLIAINFEPDEATTETEATTESEAPVETEVEPASPVSQEAVRNSVLNFEPVEGEGTIATADIKLGADGTYIIRLSALTEEQEVAFLDHLREDLGAYNLIQSRNVSPTYAKTFRDRAIVALLVASAMIILYITFAFRKVSRGIKSWKLGVTAIIALVHDVVIIVGLFVLLGAFYQVEIDALFITALLSVMGFSVNDTIVVFDRVRENLLRKRHDESFDDVAERSLQQTLARSINTSFSTLLVLVSLLVFGAYEIFYFVLALALGVVVGTYSSIFLATPLLTVFQRQDR